MKRTILILSICLLAISAYAQGNKKTVVLTFDDASASHYSFIAPLLKKYGFGATFYVCEFPPDFSDSCKYMNWRQIQQLSKMGFEIGNHTWHHQNIDKESPAALDTELSYIEQKCRSLDIPKPTSFAYPAYVTDTAKTKIFRQHGYVTARVGGDRAWVPGIDDPMYVPSFTIKGNDSAYFYHALEQAGKGKVIVFTVHGVPDNAHSWVNTPPEVFEKYMQYLYAHHYKVIAIRDIKVNYQSINKPK